MKNTHHISIAALVVAGFVTTGCSQQQITGGASQAQVAGGASQMQIVGGSQSQQQVKPETPKPQQPPKVIVKEKIVIKEVCSAKCAKPQPKRPQWGHTHRAIPRCTDSVRHSHKYNSRKHSHKYSCKKSWTKPAPKKYYKPRPSPSPRPQWGHTHPAIPGCTASIRHAHKYNARNHSHHYSCRGANKAKRPVPAPTPRYVPKPKPPVDVHSLQRKLKAKGYYKGPIDGVVGTGTRSALQRFMQNRR